MRSPGSVYYIYLFFSWVTKEWDQDSVLADTPNQITLNHIEAKINLFGTI